VGRADGDEDRVRPLEGLAEVGREGEAAARLVALDQGLEAGLVDRDPALLEHPDLALVLVDADHVEPELGEAGAGDEADIARADHGDAHGRELPRAGGGVDAGRQRQYRRSISPKPGWQVVAAAGQRHDGLEVAQLVAAVEALALEAKPWNGVEPISRAMASVSWISPPAPGPLLGRCPEDLGQEDVAADHREARGRLRRPRLLHQPRTSDPAALHLARRDHAVAAGLLLRHLHHRDDVAAGLRVRLDHLPQAGHVAADQVVDQADGERLVPDHVAGAPDGVAEALGLLLAGVDHVARGRHVALEDGELGLLALALERVEQLEGAVEMVLDDRLAAAGDEHELLDARGRGLLQRVLDDRPVDDGQHLLRQHLGGREHARAQPATGKTILRTLLVAIDLPALVRRAWTPDRPASAAHLVRRSGRTCNLTGPQPRPARRPVTA
jgi:hypothetical protein